MEQKLIRERYKEEQKKLTRKSGRIFSSVVLALFIFLAFLEYKGNGVNDVFIIRSVIAICFGIFLTLAFVYHKHDKWIIPLYAASMMLAISHYIYLLILKEIGGPLDEGIQKNIETAAIAAFLVCAGASFGARKFLIIYYGLMILVFNVASSTFETVDIRQNITINSILILSLVLMRLFHKKDFESFSRLQMLVKSEQDLSDKNQELVQLNQYVHNFTSLFSQQMKNPIRNATSFTHLMMRKIHKDETELAVECGEYVLDSLQNMNELVQSLLVFSKLEQHQIQLKPIDMQGLFSDALEEKLLEKEEDELTSILRRNKASAKVQIDPMPTIYGDPVLLGELARNLVSNAIKYSENEDLPQIRVGAKIQADEPVFFIEDNGVGFDEQYKEHIFHLFQRLHNNGEFKGAGVGLTVAERVVRLHKGRIWAESEEGKGSRFYFTIPQKNKYMALNPSKPQSSVA